MSSDPSLDRLRPLLRTILPVLLYAAGLELFIQRVVSPQDGLFHLPGRHSSPVLRLLLDQVGLTLFHFAALMAIAVVILLGMASMALHGGLFPRAAWVGPGLVLIGVWSLGRFFYEAPALDLAFHLLSACLALGILAGLFGESTEPAPRHFAVLLAAALACGVYVAISSTLESVSGQPLRFDVAGRQSSELLTLACGALVPTLVPWPRTDQEPRDGFVQAVLAAIPAALFLLLYSHRGTAAAEVRRWDLGWSWDLPLPRELLGFAYAAVLFLFFFSVFRALRDPTWRLRGFGLAFLFLAGLHYRLAYQHLLALMGLVLLVRGHSDVPEARPDGRS